MPANVGKMFYFGEVPWHKEGVQVQHPLSVEEALETGGLDWEVESIKMNTAENPPSPVCNRIAIVRKDKTPPDPKRVLGVAHTGFKPLQNRKGARIFDSIFGKGQKVYHTGGYFGKGEVVWLMAKLPGDIHVGPGDKVCPYALYSNSHDGSRAIDFRLTTVRVVCQNTLSLALRDKGAETVFKRAHQGSYDSLQREAHDLFKKTINAVSNLEETFRQMLETILSDEHMELLVISLFPIPKKPNVAEDAPLMKGYNTRLERIKYARRTIDKLRRQGKGTELKGVRESVWGGFNAILEYLDHYQFNGRSSMINGLFGNTAALKSKAFEMTRKLIKV